MKKTNYQIILICLFVSLLLIFFIGCDKKDVRSTKEDSLSSLDSKNSDQIILNFTPATENIRKKSENEIPISSITSAWPFNSKTTQLKVSGCGGFFSRSYGGSGYYVYPQDTIDASSMVEGSTITVNVSAYDTPNKFSIYNTSGGLVASSPWMGYANYGGPWGQSLNTNPNGTLSFTKSSSSTYFFKVETSVNGISDSYNAAVSCTPPSSITKTYAGVSIKYYASTGMLHFNSIADLTKVFDTLNSRYETYNANYENQYSSLTPDQLDSVDAVTNFDEFYTFRQFEALFPGFTSKRSQLEGIENTWLNNNFTGPDPDSLDPTFDNAENTVLNTSNKFIIGLPDPLTVIAQILASAIGTNPCFTNKGKSGLTTPINNRRFRLKVGIKTWIGVHSAVVGKVVSLRLKNGGWKRSRTRLAVYIGGTNLYNNQCSVVHPAFSHRDPSPNGFKKRRELRRNYTIWGSNWYTQSGQLLSSFDAPDVPTTGSLPLQ